MSVNIKNYTSTAPAIQSQGKIEKCLVEAGATDISKKYENGICVAVTFRMMINLQPMFFKLPAKVNPCFDVLIREYKRTPTPDQRKNTMQQAERTAWKIVSDWVEIQLSMILLEQAETLQIFLPYVYDPIKDVSFYEQLQQNNFKGLLSPSIS